MWYLVHAPLGISSACFQVTCVTLLSATHQHSDVRSPRQLQEVVLREILLFNIKAP
jgi:hypothetical protein